MTAPPLAPHADWHDDATFHVIVRRHPCGNFLPEMNVEDVCDRAAIVKWVYEQQTEPEDIIAIYAFNPFEGWARDVTEDIAREVGERFYQESRDPTCEMRNFIEHHCGLNTVIPAVAVPPSI